MAASNGLALVLAVGAFGLAGYAALNTNAPLPDNDVRLEALETELAELRATLASRNAINPLLQGAPRAGTSLLGSTRPDPSSTAPSDALASSDPAVVAKMQDELRTLVDASVAKKAKEVAYDMRIKANKKPAFDDLAKTLELTDEQRKATRIEVLRGQSEAMSVLRVETADGRIFYDDIVDTVAQAFAKPQDAAASWGKLMGRLMSEQVPGTDQTYAMRLDGIKKSMSSSFQRLWTPAQFKEYEAWRPDPLEIKGLEGGPRSDLETAIRERASALGIELPRDDK